MDSEYVRTIERQFSSAPFRMEWRSYNGTSSKPGIWQILHQSNGAIIATGDTPALAVGNLNRMTAEMETALAGAPFRGRKADA